MAVSRGKAFENIVRKQLSEDNKNLVERLYDQTSGYKNSTNPADFILFRDGKLFYLECKSIKGASIPKSNLVQLDRMLERVKGRADVFGIFIIWFVDKKETYWVDCRLLDALFKLYDLKSLNKTNLNIDMYDLPYLNSLGFITNNYYVSDKVPAEYKKIYGKYDFEKILKYYGEN